MAQEVTSIVHKYLDQALPLQPKVPLKAKSLFEFVIEEPGNLKDVVTQSQELNKTSDQYLLSKKNIHHIGDTLCELFKHPIYKSHQLINTSNEEAFASWNTDENFKLSTWHTEYPSNDEVLQFQSRFQSGNLGVASYSPLNTKAYYLALQKDSNSSKSTTQWFYFCVKNRRNMGSYTFHIVNYVKPFSMFRVGMKPCVYSVKSGKGWERSGNNIEYRRNSIRYEEQKSYQFTHQDDEVYFAYCYPYTYTRLQRFLDDIEQRHVDKMRRKVLTKTLGNNAVELVIITNPQIVHKRVLCFSARVHPGETISSFVCEAIIEFLLSSHPDAEKLRNQFIIKIIPMLNPDGVIHGNYRTSLSGTDLNRQWKNPDKALHQQIYYSKKIITQSQYKKLLYIDLHGHSKKRSTFMYGCVSQKNPYGPKELPYILSKQMQHFSYFNCNFTTPKSKEGTSRITLWKAGVEFSYTYELSFCGPQKQKRHFNIRDYESIGTELCRNLNAYYCNRVLALGTDQQLSSRCQQFYDDQQLLNVGNEETNGSSSELQDEKVEYMPCTQPLRPRNMFKRGHLSSQRTQNREISHILQNYLSKYQGNQSKSRGDELRDPSREKGESEKEIYARQKQSFMVTRVNLQEIALQDHLFTSMSSFYGLAADKTRQPEQINQSLFKNVSHSFSYSEKKTERFGNESFGLLLPNVQKGQYKKYDRYKRNGKSVCEQRLVSMHVQSVIQQSMMAKLVQSNKFCNQSNKIKREISLAERIRSRTNDRRDTKF